MHVFETGVNRQQNFITQIINADPRKKERKEKNMNNESYLYL